LCSAAILRIHLSDFTDIEFLPEVAQCIMRQGA